MIKKQLKHLIPNLTYKIHNRYTQNLEMKQGEKAAKAFYSSFVINQATEATAAALEKESKVSAETMETLVTEIAETVIDKKFRSPTSSIQKNSKGGRKILRSQPSTQGSSTHTPVKSNKRKGYSTLDEVIMKTRRTNSGRKVAITSNLTLEEKVNRYNLERSRISEDLPDPQDASPSAETQLNEN